MSEQQPPANWLRGLQGAEHPDSTRLRTELGWVPLETGGHEGV